SRARRERAGVRATRMRVSRGPAPHGSTCEFDVMSTKPIVLLTGAAHGIGRATAVALARRGHALGLIDRDANALFELVQELTNDGATTAHVAVDVTDR